MKSETSLLSALPSLKGAPLSILMILSLSGNRQQTVTDLAEASGFSEKPIRRGLGTLRSLGMIEEPRKNRYQLAGKEYQLPLSWDERVLPSGVSPDFAGVSPVFSGVSPELERRVSLLESAVFGKAAGVSPDFAGDMALLETGEPETVEVIAEERDEYSGNIPGKLGVFPFPGGSAKRSRCTIELKAGDSPAVSGVSPEKEGDIPETLINNINHSNDKEASKLVSPDSNLQENSNTEEINPAAEAESRWTAVLSQMRGQLGEGGFRQMFGGSKLIGYEDGHYTIGLSSGFVRDWVEQRKLDEIERMLTSMADRKQTVSFVVEQVSSDSPADPYQSQRNQSPQQDLLTVTGKGANEEINVETCNDYLAAGNEKGYTVEQLRELVDLDPDPEIMRFALPRLSCFQSVRDWCGFDIVKVRSGLLKSYRITGAANREISRNPNVTLELIEEQCEGVDPKDMGLAITRINMAAAIDTLPE